METTLATQGKSMSLGVTTLYHCQWKLLTQILDRALHLNQLNSRNHSKEKPVMQEMHEVNHQPSFLAEINICRNSNRITKCMPAL